jgi:hypothetical protein
MVVLSSRQQTVARTSAKTNVQRVVAGMRVPRPTRQRSDFKLISHSSVDKHAPASEQATGRATLATDPPVSKVEQTPLPPNIIPKTVPSKIPEDGLIVINGRKKSGKTFMCHWLLAMMAPKYDGGMFISDSMHTIMQWRINLPSGFIFQNPDDAKQLVQLIKDWLIVVKSRNDKRVERGQPMRKYLLVLDDIGYDSKTLNSTEMRRLIQNARQVGVSIWIITQYLYQLHQQIREAIDFAICFRETSAKALKKIKEDVFHIIGSDFEAVFKAATGRRRKRRPDEEEVDYNKACPPRAICIDNRIGGNAESWHDCISCVSADYRDVEKPWRLANPVHYVLDKMTVVNDAERRAKDEGIKNAYARSEVGLQVYNNDFIDKIKTKSVFVLEDDYLSQINGGENSQRSVVGRTKRGAA